MTRRSSYYARLGNEEREEEEEDAPDAAEDERDAPILLRALSWASGKRWKLTTALET
jgi:hypothetical protein